MITSSSTRWAGHVAHTGEMRVLVGRPQGKRTLGRSRRGWEDNFKLLKQQCGNEPHTLTSLPPYPLKGWTPGPVWMFWRIDISLAPARNQTKILPSSSSQNGRNNKWNIPALWYCSIYCNCFMNYTVFRKMHLNISRLFVLLYNFLKSFYWVKKEFSKDLSYIYIGFHVKGLPFLTPRNTNTWLIHLPQE